ncbi:c-type cytochrome biogenesis protein CcmI [Roseobacteraceae bacterium S113]
MILALAAIALAVLTAAFVLAPVLRRSEARVDHAEGALAIFADQIAEVDREEARGLITPSDAEAARVEIKRRMLSTAKTRTAASHGSSAKWPMFALALMAPAFGGLIYAQVGSPGAQSLPFADRAEERAGDAEIIQLTNELRARLTNDPEGGPTDGWVLLGQTYMRMNRPGDAALAFGRIADRPDANSSVLSQYAEALITAEGGIVTNRAVVIVERARALDARNPAALYYWALWLNQEGRTAEAIEAMGARISQEGEYRPWMDFYVATMSNMSTQAGGPPLALETFLTPQRGPSQDDIAAAQDLSEEERAAFIRSMVDGLAARLEEEGDDLDGWMQLGRAYMVLGERENALAAFQSAAGLLDALPADDIRRQIVAEGLSANAAQ